MPRRGNEPEEALGPQLDGLKEMENFGAPLPAIPAHEEDPLRIDLPLPMEEDACEPALLPEEPVALIFGDTPEAEAVVRLAAQCGFAVEVALDDDIAATADKFPDARKIHFVPDYLDLVNICGIDRGFYVCVFVSDMDDCEIILSQCLASPAFYLGVNADRDEKQRLYAMLKEDGAPDAELAAVCCPMGLAIGSENPEQTAVAIVAELLAARAGTLKRLRLDE